MCKFYDIYAYFNNFSWQNYVFLAVCFPFLCLNILKMKFTLDNSKKECSIQNFNDINSWSFWKAKQEQSRNAWWHNRLIDFN